MLASWNVVDRRFTDLGRTDCGVRRGVVRRSRRAGGLQWQLGLLVLTWGTWWSEVESRLGEDADLLGTCRHLGSIWVETTPNL